jgi:hypothetical protein
MRVDCHCHVVSKDGLPAVWLMQSRFSIVVERGLLEATFDDGVTGMNAVRFLRSVRMTVK